MDIEAKVNDLFHNLTKLDELEECRVDHINDYLKMSHDDISALREEDCEQISFELLQHSLYVQKKTNLIKAALDFLKWNLRKEIVEDISKIKGMSWDNAEALAIKQNTYATTIHDKILEYQAMLTAAYNIVSILQDFSKRFEGIKYGKRSYNRHAEKA